MIDRNIGGIFRFGLFFIDDTGIRVIIAQIASSDLLVPWDRRDDKQRDLTREYNMNQSVFIDPLCRGARNRSQK